MHRKIGASVGDRTLDLTREQTFAADRRERTSIAISRGGDDLDVHVDTWMGPLEKILDDR
jgi:hypothetical protein